jgi:acetyl esterase/lipase
VVLGSVSSRSQQTARAWRFTSSDVRGSARRFACALVITAENDVLRDEGEAHGRKLSEAGVETVVTRYKGAIHDFVLLNRIAKAAPVRAALLEATEFLKGVLV